MPNSWHPPSLKFFCSAAALACTLPMAAQTSASPYIAQTRAAALEAAGVQVSGDVHMGNGQMELGNGSTITAGSETVPITLNRGGELNLCATTTVHLARDRSIQAPDASGLMLGLDRGALEAHYQTSKYSDVLLTPDLRILISGPGEANLSIRVNRQGDTCIDNPGQSAPYITVTSQLEGGLYRVQPGQHVSFQHGSLREVVDTEHEPCGCPAPVAVATVTPPASPGSDAHPVGGPTSTPADTAFPLAVSEGLTSTPLPPTTPVAAPGEVHAQVAVPFRYNGTLPTVNNLPASSVGETAPAATTASAVPPPSTSAPAPSASNMAPPALPAPPKGSALVIDTTPVETSATIPAASTSTEERKPVRTFFRRVGHFFSRLFGAEE